MALFGPRPGCRSVCPDQRKSQPNERRNCAAPSRSNQRPCEDYRSGSSATSRRAASRAAAALRLTMSRK